MTQTRFNQLHVPMSHPGLCSSSGVCKLGIRTVGGVVNGDDDAGGEHNLLPGLANVDNIDAIGARLPQVRLHVHLHVLGPEMALCGEQHLDVLRRRVENGGEVAGSHLCGLASNSAVVV